MHCKLVQSIPQLKCLAYHCCLTRPPELFLMHSPRAEVVKLVNIAKIAHKYCFKSLESWSCEAILNYVSRQPSPFNNTSNQEWIPMIIRLAHLCHQDRLLETSIQLMKQFIARSEVFLLIAMNLADELGITSLRGTAYFEALNRGHQFWMDCADVSQAQRICLLYGYYRLSKEWERIRTVPPRFEHANSCGVTWHSNQCMTSWNDFWKKNTTSDVLMNLSLADVGGRLRLIVKELDRWGQVERPSSACINVLMMFVRRALCTMNVGLRPRSVSYRRSSRSRTLCHHFSTQYDFAPPMLPPQAIIYPCLQ